MPKGQVFTYQTRIPSHPALDAYADLYGRVERKLFPEIRAGRPPEDLKSSYLELFRIPARLFNSARISALGKISSAQECQALNIQDLTVRTKSLEKKLAKIKDPFNKHQKARRLGILKGQLERLLLDQASGRVRIAFGSKELWRAQSHLEGNSYSSHQEWLEEWRSARSSEFFIVGSKEETGGCQLCTPSLQEDVRVAPRLRLPDALTESWGKYLEFNDLDFNHGRERLQALVIENQEFLRIYKSEGRARAKESGLGSPLSFKFKRDRKGWRVMVSLRMPTPEVITSSRAGLIGVDINSDHLAVSETDWAGNWLSSWSIPLCTYGKSKDQALALIGDAAKDLVQIAHSRGKSLVLERLDFSEKRRD